MNLAWMELEHRTVKALVSDKNKGDANVCTITVVSKIQGYWTMRKWREKEE